MTDNTSASQSTKIVKRKPTTIVKSFRLIDFNVFDQKKVDNDND
jgi:hypothetical protein